MKLAIMQPYLFPYMGYWQLINAVDRFVLLDDVNFIKRGWINRNKISTGLITLPVDGASQNRLINDIDIHAWDKFPQRVHAAYRKAPYFKQGFELINRPPDGTNLSQYIYQTILDVCAYLDIQTKIIRSSSVYGKELAGPARIIDICKQERADLYINPSGGIHYYDRNAFIEAGIDITFLRCRTVNALSIIDFLMNYSKEEIKTMLYQYELFS